MICRLNLQIGDNTNALAAWRMLLCVVVTFSVSAIRAEESEAEESHLVVESRVRGMILGSLLGDAIGGPIEFKSREELAKVLPNLQAMNHTQFESFRSTTHPSASRLFSYKELRPEVAPYGPWERLAEDGTVTDDSRHKMILMHCLRQLASNGTGMATSRDLANAYLDYFQQPRWSADYRRLAKDSFREYHQAARWILGQRDLDVALPPERIWAGVANCSGQMALLPVAAMYPGNSDHAYRAAYHLGFMDTGQAKDINSALVGSLATAIGSQSEDVRTRWREVREAIRTTDPYRYSDVPFAKRPATEWLDFAIKVAEEAEGSPKRLYESLEKHGRPKYYWDAHFTYATTWACLHFAAYDPDLAMYVNLAFGHDTDSTAQLIGAYCGAVHGDDLFPTESVAAVSKRLQADYGESVDKWCDTLKRLRDPIAFPRPVAFAEATE